VQLRSHDRRQNFQAGSARVRRPCEVACVDGSENYVPRVHVESMCRQSVSFRPPLTRVRDSTNQIPLRLRRIFTIRSKAGAETADQKQGGPSCKQGK
jgi:hypothetical protein